MDGSVIGLAVAGSLVFVLGMLIRVAGMVELIAGYDPDRVADEEGLASFVGANVIAVGLLGIGCAAILYFEPVSDPSVVWIGFVVGTFAFAFRAIRGASRYETDMPT